MLYLKDRFVVVPVIAIGNLCKPCHIIIFPRRKIIKIWIAFQVKKKSIYNIFSRDSIWSNIKIVSTSFQQEPKSRLSKCRSYRVAFRRSLNSCQHFFWTDSKNWLQLNPARCLKGNLHLASWKRIILANNHSCIHILKFGK